MKKKSINFYGLIHYKKNENAKLNFKSSSDQEKIIVYLKNAFLLSNHLNDKGFNFILLTNNKNYINRLLKKINCKIKVKEIKFKTLVRKNTHFYSCHYRVDVFRYFSSVKNSYSILIDLDTIAINKLSKNYFLNYFNYGFVNNITKNVIPAYGKKNILKYLRILEPDQKEIVWYGGDFFAGNQKFFKILHNISMYYQAKFYKNFKYLKNQTDELFITLSILKMKNLKLYKIKDTTFTKLFARYWSSSTLHKQKDLNYYFSYKLLHLPADKIFLANLYQKNIKEYDFKEIYYNYINSNKFLITKFIKKNTPTFVKKGIKKIL